MGSDKFVSLSIRYDKSKWDKEYQTNEQNGCLSIATIRIDS